MCLHFIAFHFAISQMKIYAIQKVKGVQITFKSLSFRHFIRVVNKSFENLFSSNLDFHNDVSHNRFLFPTFRGAAGRNPIPWVKF